MKVLDLQCRRGHVFEGWFASEDDFQSQKQRGLMQCRLCADDGIEKRLSAPRLNLGARESVSPTKPSTSAHTAADLVPQSLSPLSEPAGDSSALQAAWLSLSRKLIANTEDVGQHFAREARRMHHGEVAERGIRGQASPSEALELLEEGIAVMPLSLPAAAKETLQ